MSAPKNRPNTPAGQHAFSRDLAASQALDVDVGHLENVAKALTAMADLIRD